MKHRRSAFVLLALSWALGASACGAAGAAASGTTRAATTPAATVSRAKPAAPESTVSAGATGVVGSSAAVPPASAVPTTRAATARPTSPVPAARASGSPATAPSDAVASRTMALYLVGVDGDGRTNKGAVRPRLRLFREFVPVPGGGASGSAADRAATRAVAAAMTLVPAPYRRPWGEQSVVSTRKDASGITVTLTGAAPAADGETARLAVASLVWTATAAYQADVPVRFVVPGGTIIGDRRSSTTYRRSTGVDRASELAGIWIDTPALGASAPAGPVTAKGQASVWEATMSWTLTRGGAMVRTGVVTASEGAPGRGSWSAALGSLSRGSYTLVVEAASPVDGGGATARTTHSFTVR